MANRIEQEIRVSVVGGKEVKELEKQIKALEKQKAELVVSVDVDDDEARKQLDALDAQIADLKGEKAQIVVEANVDRALSALDTVATEAKKAEVAADALSVALGPDLAGKADLDSIISDFNRMGLSMEDIAANADRLGGKLREIGTKDVGGRLTTGLSRINTETKSAGSSASVMANALGNATQDIGQVAGIAGTAGVAIGQMGEYMADAAFSGEGLRSVLTNFAKVAGPLAVLVVALEVVNGAMATHKARAEEAAAATEQLGEAMEGASDPALGLAADMEPIVDRFEEFNQMDTGFWTDLVGGIQGAAGALPGLGAALGVVGVDVTDMVNSVHDVMPTLRQAGVDSFDLAKFIAGTGEAAGTKISRAFQDGVISAEQYVAALQAITRERDRAAQSGVDDKFFDVGLGQLRALDEAARKAADPLSFYGDQWSILMEDMRDGTVDTEAAAAAFRFLADNLPDTVDPMQVVRTELDKQNKALEEGKEAAEKWAEAQQKAADEAAAAFVDATIAIDDMASVFSVMERNTDAISLAFDLGNAPLEALEAVVDINDAIRDLGKFIKDNDGVVPNIFDPNDIDAGPFLAKIESLRTPIQQAVTDAFATGGPAAARATADAYVTQITESMRGKLTDEQVRDLLGLGDLEATLKVAVDQASLATATQLLEVLTGLAGETPWTATVQLALAAGEITPDAARILIAGRLEELGVPVPATLEEPSEGSKTAAKAAADRWMAQPGHEVDMQTAVDDPDLQSLIDARNAGQDDADKMPITFPSRIANPTVPLWMLRGNDAGNPSVPYPGGIAGERGPEILNDRWLTTGTTYVPPGTKVTSRRRTAVILRQHGTRGLRPFDNGGVVPAGPVTVNFNGVGAIGNRFDVDRQVRRSMQRIQRIYGTR